METRYTKQELSRDVVEIMKKCMKEQYMMTPSDWFAIGYMCAKYDVKKLLNNQDEVMEACRKYDEDDDLGLLDTIGETLIDLGIINNDEHII